MSKHNASIVDYYQAFVEEHGDTDELHAQRHILSPLLNMMVDYYQNREHPTEPLIVTVNKEPKFVIEIKPYQKGDSKP
jgi:hypothetical protein